jgi:hypothetical protein
MYFLFIVESHEDGIPLIMTRLLVSKLRRAIDYSLRSVGYVMRSVIYFMSSVIYFVRSVI